MSVRISLMTFVFVVASVFGPLHVQAQQIDFRSLSANEELSRSAVHAVAQDRSGFLWFGTGEGLVRYDGYTLTVYTNNPADPNSISGNTVFRLLPGSDGDLWIAVLDGGLNRYDHRRDLFVSYKHDAGDSTSLSDNNVTSLHQSEDGFLWVGTSNGLDRFDPITRRFKRFTNSASEHGRLSQNDISAIAEDRNGNLWIGTLSSGLNKIDQKSKSVTQYRHDNRDPHSLSSQWILSLYTDRHGVLWIGTVEGGLNRYDPEKLQFSNYRHDPKRPESLGSNVVICMYEDREGYLWVGTDRGVDRFDRARNQFHHYTHDPANPESLGEGAVSAICEDASGLVWFGTDKGGVQSYNPAKARFLHYGRNPTDPKSLSEDDVSALCEDRAGGLWVGTNGGGLNYLPTGTKAFRHHRHDPGDPASIGSDYITSVCEQRNGDVWVGTRDGRLDRFDRKKEVFVHYAYKREGVPPNHPNIVNTIYEDRGGNLWVGDAFGLARVDVRKNTFVHQRLLQGNTVLSIYEGDDGNSWIGTWRKGLYRLDQMKNRLATYRHDPGNVHSLGDNTVWCITRDESGRLWVGTGRGLDYYDPSLDGFTHYTEKEGLYGSVVYGILVDNKENLWLSTDKGLSEFSPDTKSFRNYGAGDGLQDVRFNEGGFWKGRMGQMFFGSKTGVYAFFPEDVQYETQFPAVVLTSFNVFDRPLQLEHAISAVTDVSLTHQQNFLSIGYAALDYAAPGRTQYAYMLEPQDKDWISAGTVHSASYQYLEPAEYVFRVKASNTPGLWEENSTSIRIAITPPFWRRWWFQVASAALFVGFLGVLYRRRIADLTRGEVAQKEFLAKLIETQETDRKRIASDLHDGLGQGLLVVNSELQEYLRQNGAAKVELERVSSLVQESIDEVREIASDLHPHHLEKLGLRVALEMIVDRMSHSSNVLFHFTSDEIDDLFTKNEQIILYRIVQEAVSNIVRHSGATNATIEIQKRAGEMRLTVLDDGKGFSVRRHQKKISSTRDLKNRGYGFGLLTMTERARLIGGSLVIESGPGEGTKLALHIPLINHHAKEIVKGVGSIFP